MAGALFVSTDITTGSYPVVSSDMRESSLLQSRSFFASENRWEKISALHRCDCRGIRRDNLLGFPVQQPEKNARDGSCQYA